MERLFEEDLANAREVRLVSSARGTKAEPDRPINDSNRGARRGVVGSGTGSSATIVRVGSAALQKSGAPLRTHEHALAAATSASLLGISLLGLRFPRLLAWPLALIGTVFGGLGVVRAARSVLSGRDSPPEPENTESGER
jgi:cardiolipin synthase A/B